MKKKSIPAKTQAKAQVKAPAKTQAKDLVPAASPGFAEVPAYLQKGNSRGMELVQRDDILLPRVKLLQQMSPEVVEKKNEAGIMINSVTGESLGKELSFIPVFHFKSRMLFSGRGKDAQIVCSSPDGVTPNSQMGPSEAPTCAECLKAQWPDPKKTKGEKAEGPECVQFYNFPILILSPEAEPLPAGLSMAKTKIKVGKKLLTLARHAGPNLDLFALRFRLLVVTEQSPEGPYFNFDVQGAGFATEKEYRYAEKFYEVLKGTTITVDTKGVTHDDPEEKTK